MTSSEVSGSAGASTYNGTAGSALQGGYGGGGAGGSILAYPPFIFGNAGLSPINGGWAGSGGGGGYYGGGREDQECVFSCLSYA